MKKERVKLNISITQWLLVLLLVLPQSVGAVILSTTFNSIENTVIYDVMLDTETVCINAGAIDISYNNEHYSVVGVENVNSLFNLWITEPFIDEDNGLIKLEGGVLWGYCGDRGEVSLARIILEKKEVEVVSLPNIVIYNTSRVLLHDGIGTEASVTIVLDSGEVVD